MNLNFSLMAQANKKRNSSLLKGAYRTDENSWIYVHMQGTPQQIGYQNGWLLWDSIARAMRRGTPHGCLDKTLRNFSFQEGFNLQSLRLSIA